MARTMNLYTVKELAGLVGDSVRTLHHYDRIGFPRPRARTNSGSECELDARYDPKLVVESRAVGYAR